MKSTKKPIHFNSHELDDINHISKLNNFGDISISYGSIPKTLKFSITFEKAMLEVYDKVIPDLSEAELDIFFTTIKNYRKEKFRLKQISELQKQA